MENGIKREVMVLIDGKSVAAELEAELAAKVKELETVKGRVPHLVAVLVGDDGASATYVNNKVKACQACGFRSSVVRYDDDVEQARLMGKIRELNADEGVDGFIVQLPLPSHIDEQEVIGAIDYRKDVDGFNPINVGRLMLGLPTMPPATPQGIIMLLRHYGVATSGKKCVILGRSNIVGKPMAALMMQKNGGDATVTVCHSHTANLREECLGADILIAAMGRPAFVRGDMVKEGACVIDVGTTRVPDASRKRGYRLQGDVAFDEVAPKCSYITPVPGGVGPMTICSLMRNTLKAYLNK